MFKNRELADNEEEFLRLNSEIDSKTKALMEQVDQVMKQQATDQEELDQKWASSKDADAGLPREDRILRARPSCHSAGASVVAGGVARHKSESVVLPDSVKGMGHDSVVRFLKAKLKVLADQIEILQSDERKHLERIKELQADRERVAEDRDKWIQQANIAKNVLVKHEQHASNMVLQMQNVQAENGHLKREEVEKLRKELKQTTQSSGSNEVRLNRSVEEVERLRSALRQAKQDEKELRETHRKKAEELSAAAKRLDKQRIELLHAFKKQLVVIDNLKKQKGLVEAGRFVKSVEDDFMEFLDWSPGGNGSCLPDRP